MTNEWTNTELPDFKGWKILVLGGAFHSACVSLFARAGFQKASTVKEADIVAFIGGTDVDPFLYDQRPVAQTQQPDVERDAFEQDVYFQCLEHNIPMVGICRGAQFLHVMNGGQLWQHVSGHAGPDHWIVDFETGRRVKATSLHHQMLQINDDIEVIASTEDRISSLFISADLTLNNNDLIHNSDISPQLEIEAGAYWNTQSFFVQGHPEIGSLRYQSWFLTKLESFLDRIEINNNTTYYLSPYPVRIG